VGVRLALFLVAALLWAQGEGREIPPFEGDGNSQHDGQPKWCQDGDRNGYKHNCACGMKCDEDGNVVESSKCRAYCRPKSCFCSGMCSTRR
jgi:hypothetical protein